MTNEQYNYIQQLEVNDPNIDPKEVVEAIADWFNLDDHEAEVIVAEYFFDSVLDDYDEEVEQDFLDSLNILEVEIG